MSFDTYANLKLEYENWTDRDDRDSEFDSFLRLIELDVSDDLKLRSQDAEDSGTLAGGSNIVLTPARILYARELVFAGSGGKPVIVNAVSLQTLQETEHRLSGSTPPIEAAVYGVDVDYKTQILVAPTPNADVDYTLRYTDAVEPLVSGGAGVNYLLAVHPDVYHYGLQKHCAEFDEDWENFDRWERRYERARARAKRIEWRSRLTLGRNRMRVQGGTP